MAEVSIRCDFCQCNHSPDTHADIIWQSCNDVIVVKDLNKGSRSATNDMEYIIWMISQHLIPPNTKTHLLDEFKLIYSDSEGYYDQVVLNCNNMIYFKPVVMGRRTRDMNEAVLAMSTRRGF